MKDSSTILSRVSAELDYLRRRQALHQNNHNAAQPVPPCCRASIRSLPGNASCIDCGAANPEWANVTYGSLICMTCAGRHRSFGVGISVVRSLFMDDMTVSQVLSLLEGGNEQLQTFLERHQLGCSSPLAEKRYHTKAALFYKTQMHRHVKALAERGRYLGREASRKNSSSHSSTSSIKKQCLGKKSTTNGQNPAEKEAASSFLVKRPLPVRQLVSTQ